MQKERSKEYIIAKIEKCEGLLKNDPTNPEYINYLDFWKTQTTIKKPCPICNRTLLEKNYDDHYSKCLAKKEELEIKKAEADKLEAERIAESKRLHEAKEAKKKEAEEIRRRLAELEAEEETNQTE